MIRENLEQVRKNIADACARAGRDPSEVILLAVSKTKPLEMIREAVAAGQRAFGENYVQELTEKYEALGNSVDWHMIGHLQRNKVKYIIGKTSLIHSVDSIRLAEQIEKEAEKKDVSVDVLLEVNVAHEDSKWGFTPEETIEAVKTVSAFPHVHVCGLMTSAPITEDPESNRPYFCELRRLFDTIAASAPEHVDMRVLSMGMTGDYQVAVEEGATLVRVGTGIFGARDYGKHD
ncbi:MAG: YggS family pyridoxal phosphate-dependent enzyme [Lachnospiraceae bacterium]|nr:YggS family pyridoxal phosphate-dependent enzyme [Lachnospiraceae bacterium]